MIHRSFLLAATFFGTCLLGCNAKPAEPNASSNASAAVTQPATSPAKVPSYEELLGPTLAQKVKDGGPWSFDDLKPINEALIALKKVREDLSASGHTELAALAKQRHDELSATYITLRQVAINAGRLPAPTIAPVPASRPDLPQTDAPSPPSQ